MPPMQPRQARPGFDFWFDYSCPYAYLASTQVASLAARTGAELRYKPMLLGGVFRAVGTPQRLFAELSPQKAKHNALDLQRWADLFGVALTMPTGHPLRTVEALRATLLARVDGEIDPRVVDGFYRAYWIDGRGPSEDATMRDVLGAAGHDAGALIARLDEKKDDLRVRTDEAIALGIFGAPAFVVDGEMYWGQDRIAFVEEALAKSSRKNGANEKR
jgi:2-hydroxychromene-2-carboxylate isomerase